MSHLGLNDTLHARLCVHDAIVRQNAGHQCRFCEDTRFSSSTDRRAGHTLGREVEAGFTAKAKASGMTEEEARYAFNRNMLSTGLLADGAREYSETFNRRWLVTSYEAGDVVLHNPFAVSSNSSRRDTGKRLKICRSTLQP